MDGRKNNIGSWDYAEIMNNAKKTLGDKVAKSPHTTSARKERACPVHSSSPKSEASVVVDLPIKFTRKFDGSTAGDVHERERCEDVDENRSFSFSFFFLVSPHDEIETSVSPTRLNFHVFLRDEFCHGSLRGAITCFESYQHLDVVVCRSVCRVVSFSKHREF